MEGRRHGEAQERAQTCGTCGNVHKRTAFAVRTSNFAVKTEAHGTETDRKEGGTPVGGENRE